MKNLLKPLLTLGILAIAYTGHSQYAGATVSYVKVKPGKNSEYRELEKQAKEFHQARVDKGIITEWQLYRKMYTGSEDPYEYILVQHNDDFSKTQNAMPRELLASLYSEEEMAEFRKKAGETRSIIKTEYYDRVLGAQGGSRSNYIRVNWYKVKQGGEGEYVQLRTDYILPIQEELIKQGHRSGWSLWHKATYDKEFQYVSVDGFSEYGQWKSQVAMQGVVEKALPGVDMSEISPKLGETRILYKSEYWRLVDFAASDSPE